MNECVKESRKGEMKNSNIIGERNMTDCLMRKGRAKRVVIWKRSQKWRGRIGRMRCLIREPQSRIGFSKRECVVDEGPG